MSAWPERRSRLPWGLLAGVSGLVLVSGVVDGLVAGHLSAEPVRRWIERGMAVPLALGPYLVILAILASFSNRRRLCAGFLVPVLASAVVLHLMKWAVGRGRPLLGQGAYHFRPFSGAEYCDAFPSGHAMAAGVIALLLGIYFPRARWVFYLLAALIGLERIIHDWHFPSDVLAGFALAGLIVFGSRRWLGTAFYQKDGLPVPGLGEDVGPGGRPPPSGDPARTTQTTSSRPLT